MNSTNDMIPPTIFEKMLGLIPLPYETSCILITILLGTPGTLLTRYIDTLDITKTLSITGFITGSVSYYRAVAFYWILTYIFFLLYLYYFVRYFRLKTVDALNALSPLLKDKTKLKDDFSLVSNPYGSIVTAIIIGLSFAPSVYRMVNDSYGLFSAGQIILSQAVLDLGAGTGVWLFFSAIWSLRKLSKENIELRPYSEDPLLGLGPIGSISLALVMIYFGALGLRGLGIFISGVEYTPPIFNLAFESILIISGLILFYSTIDIFHKKMVEQKNLEKRKTIKDLSEKSVELGSDSKKLDQSESIMRVMVNDLINRRIDKMPTWPFGVGVLDRILTILISVISIIVARLVMSLLHI